jgi:hypothetical protein
MLIQPIHDMLINNPNASKEKSSQPSNFSDILATSTAKLTGRNPADELNPEAVAPRSNQLVTIGTITSKNPTVSNLLIRNSEYKKDCWRIIHAAPNRKKPFTKIQAGTTVFYDPKTKELLWGKMIKSGTEKPTQAIAKTNPLPEPGKTICEPLLYTKTAPLSSKIPPAVEPVAINENLVSAIQPMIGKTYSDVDCYELLVSGLSNLGFTYTGKKGFGRKLINMALNKGLPMNAYLNGEGLVKLSGNKVYARSFMQVHHPENQASSAIKELQPYLKKGAILSFSTESRGHTGIVSNKNGAWTFINSGVMDNTLGARSLPKGVGEEDLNKEIHNWFELAARRKESLKITLGQLDKKKLASFYNPVNIKTS